GAVEEDVADCADCAAVTERIDLVVCIFDYRSLATQQNGTEGCALQTNSCETVEATVVAVGCAKCCASVSLDGCFQLEQSFQAVAQIFCTFETDTASRLTAGFDAVCAAVGSCAIAGAIESQVNDTVDGNGRLCVCSTCKCAHNGQ